MLKLASKIPRRLPALFLAGLVLGLPLIAQAQGFFGDAAGTLLNLLTDLGNATLVPLAQVALSAASALFDWVMSPEFNQIPLTHGILVDSGWTIMRDFANMFLVAVMIIMAFGTILGTENYGWRRLLPRLIIAALVINFSKLLAGIVIDFTNVIILFFIQNGIENAATPNQGIATVLANTMGLALLLGSRQYLENGLGISGLEGGVMAFVAMVASMVFFWIAAIVMLLLAITMIVRIIRLWLFVILAPLALAAMILPALEQFWKQWLQEFTKWAFTGVSIVFFVYLAALLAQAILTQGDLGGYIQAVTAIKNNQSPDLSFLSGSNFLGKGAPLLVFFLIVGLLSQARSLALTASGQASTVALGLVSGARQRLVPFAIRTGRAGAGRAAAATWRTAANTRTGQALHRAVTRLETVPVLNLVAKPLATSLERVYADTNKQINTEIKRLRDLHKRDEAAAINKARAMLTSRTQPTLQAAGAVFLDEQGQIDRLGINQRRDAEAAARRHGRELKSIPFTRIGVPESIDRGTGPEEIRGHIEVLREIKDELSSTKDAMKVSASELRNALGVSMIEPNSFGTIARSDTEKARALDHAVTILEEIRDTPERAHERGVIMAARGMTRTEDFNRLVETFRNILNNPRSGFRREYRERPEPDESQPPSGPA